MIHTRNGRQIAVNLAEQKLDRVLGTNAVQQHVGVVQRGFYRVHGQPAPRPRVVAAVMHRVVAEEQMWGL